jgi:RNA processing factor Prp31
MPTKKILLGLGLIGGLLVMILIASSNGGEVKVTLEQQDQKINQLANQLQSSQTLVNDALSSLVAKKNQYDQILQQLQREVEVRDKMRAAVPVPAPAKPVTTK